MKRIYLSKKKIEFSKRQEQSEKDLLMFRNDYENSLKLRAKCPKTADISFELYDSLIEANYGLKEKPKLIGELFGVKIKIDPTLRKNEVVFSY